MENIKIRIKEYKEQPFAIETEDLFLLLAEILVEMSEHLDDIKKNTKSI